MSAMFPSLILTTCLGIITLAALQAPGGRPPGTDEAAGEVNQLEEQLKASPGSIPLLKKLGYLLLRQNPMSRRAEELLRQAAEAAPADQEARFLYGQWACLNNKDSLCVTELEACLAHGPLSDNAAMQTHTMLAMAHRNRQDMQQAEAAFRKALTYNRRLSPPDPFAGYQFVKFLSEGGREDEAALLVDELLAWSPDFGPARYERARALSRSGNLEEAAKQCEVALRTLERDYPGLLAAAHAFMAKTCFALGRTDEAKTHQKWLESH